MSRIFMVIIATGILLFGLIVITSFAPLQSIFAINQGNCPSLNFLWAHTYDNARLKEHNPACVILEGILGPPHENDEGDGDLKFIIKPDKGFSDLMNKYNTKGMVIEIICWDKPKQDYIAKWGNYCHGVDPRSHIPTDLKQGDHVRVTGKWVQDVGHPGFVTHDPWNEIHPVEKIEKIP